MINMVKQAQCVRCVPYNLIPYMTTNLTDSSLMPNSRSVIVKIIHARLKSKLINNVIIINVDSN